MMNLADKIRTIYPQLNKNDFINIIILQDDGAGPYIKEWNHPTLPEPTQAELDAITGDYVKPVKEITKLSFVRWAKANGHYQALLALLDSDADLMFEWHAASELSINDPLVIGAAATLGLDAQAVFNEIGQ